MLDRRQSLVRMMAQITSSTPIPLAPHERFLTPLTRELRRQVLALPDLLERRETDYVVFTARKALCVSDALRRLGYWRGRGDYCSTRALDGDRSVFANRSVLIVDDMAASGRTIKTTADAVRRGGALDVRCFALSAEGPQHEWEPRVGVGFEPPFLESDIGESLRHTKSLISAFRALPRPYNVDWPIYDFNHRLDIDTVLDSGWTQVNSTEIPLEPVSVEFGAALAVAVAERVPDWLAALLSKMHLAKIRLYEVPDAHPEGSHFFAVPIVATGESPETAVIEQLAAFADMVGVQPAPTNTAREAYRALQYLLGELVLQVFVASFDTEAPPLDHHTPIYLFVGATRDWIVEAQQATRDWACPTFSGLASGVRPVRSLNSQQLRDAIDAADLTDSLLADTFLETFLRSREYRLRHELRATVDQQRRGEIVEELVALDRSADGASFTVAELTESLQKRLRPLDVLPANEVGRLVTEFLDTAIDAGEIVPEILQRGGAISRRFRAGEIIAFHEAEQALFERMLHAFAAEEQRPQSDERLHEERLPSRLFPIDLMQKLMVGFASFLVADGKLADLRLAGVVNRDVNRLKRRYQLRGSVLDTVSSEFVSDEPVPRSVQILLARQVIEPQQYGYLLADQPRLNVIKRDELYAINFGEVMAGLLRVKRHDGSSVFDDDSFARLVTLNDPAEQVLALGANITIAAKFLGVCQFASASALRRSGLFTSINQGLAKARWCLTGRSHRLVEEAEALMETMTFPSKNSAPSVLAALLPAPADSELRGLLEREAAWIIDSYFWVLGYEQLLLSGEEQTSRKNGITRALENAALRELGAVLGPGSPLGSRGALRARILTAKDAGYALQGAEFEALVAAAATELCDDAVELLDQCYEVDRLGSAPPPPPPDAIARCLLLRVPQPRIPNLGNREGLRRPAYTIDQAHGDPQLRRFRPLFAQLHDSICWKERPRLPGLSGGRTIWRSTSTTCCRGSIAASSAPGSNRHVTSSNSSNASWRLPTRKGASLSSHGASPSRRWLSRPAPTAPL
jgi:hypothetical protein